MSQWSWTSLKPISMDAWSLLINRCCFTLELIVYTLLCSFCWFSFSLKLHNNKMDILGFIPINLHVGGSCWCTAGCFPVLNCFSLTAALWLLVAWCFKQTLLVWTLFFPTSACSICTGGSHTYANLHQHCVYVVSLPACSNTQSSFTHLQTHATATSQLNFKSVKLFLGWSTSAIKRKYFSSTIAS